MANELDGQSRRVKIDSIDHAIIQAFRRGGRSTNSEVARLVGVSEGTVRRRVEALVRAGVLDFVVTVDPRKIGLMVDTLIGISADADRIHEIGDEIAMMPEVRYVGVAMGAFDIWVGALFESVEDWLDFRTTRLAAIRGIQRTETFQITKVLKRTYDWVTPDESALLVGAAKTTRKGAQE